MTEKVTELLKKKNLDAILISDGYNMRYLSGFWRCDRLSLYICRSESADDRFALYHAGKTGGTEVCRCGS